MSGRTYPRLNIVEFGQHLLDSGDLDPIYIAIYKAEFDEDHLYRLLLAYWCLYHLGSAAYISEKKGQDFWDAMMKAAVNEEPAPTGGRWPRGHERRHFRGGQGIAAVQELRARYGDRPEDMVRGLAAPMPGGCKALPFKTVADRVKTHRGFGPWMAFKVADMLDRLGIVPVSFDDAAVFMFDDPKKAAFMLWRQTMGLPDGAQPKDERVVLEGVVKHLEEQFSSYMAPPLMDRKVGLQEIETVLCCWKSHMNGHYPKFNDMNEIGAGLAEWKGYSASAQTLLHFMPKEAQS